MGRSILQHEQEDALAHRGVRSQGRGGRIRLREVGGRRIGFGRGDIRPHLSLCSEGVLAETQAGIERVKITPEGNQCKEGLEETDLSHSVEEASRGRKALSVRVEEGVMLGHRGRNESCMAGGARRNGRREPMERRRNTRRRDGGAGRGDTPQSRWEMWNVAGSVVRSTAERPSARAEVQPAKMSPSVGSLGVTDRATAHVARTGVTASGMTSARMSAAMTTTTAMSASNSAVLGGCGRDQTGYA